MFEPNNRFSLIIGLLAILSIANIVIRRLARKILNEYRIASGTGATKLFSSRGGTGYRETLRLAYKVFLGHDHPEHATLNKLRSQLRMLIFSCLAVLAVLELFVWFPRI